MAAGQLPACHVALLTLNLTRSFPIFMTQIIPQLYMLNGLGTSKAFITFLCMGLCPEEQRGHTDRIHAN